MTFAPYHNDECTRHDNPTMDIPTDLPEPENCEHSTLTATKHDDAPTGAEICTKCGTRVE